MTSKVAARLDKSGKFYTSNGVVLDEINQNEKEEILKDVSKIIGTNSLDSVGIEVNNKYFILEMTY